MSLVRIGEDGFVKTTYGLQDEINDDREKIYEQLEGYMRVPEELCEYLLQGANIKYINDEGYFRTGGVLLKNGYPDYLVLLNPYKKLTWSVNLKKNNIFVEDLDKKFKENIEKDNLYKLYKEGLLSIKEE